MTLQKLLEEIERLKELLKMDDSYIAHKLEGIKETVEVVESFTQDNACEQDLKLWQQIKEELDLK